MRFTLNIIRYGHSSIGITENQLGVWQSLRDNRKFSKAVLMMHLVLQEQVSALQNGRDIFDSTILLAIGLLFFKKEKTVEPYKDFIIVLFLI